MYVSIVTYHTLIDEMQRCLTSLQSPIVEKVFIIDNSGSDEIRQWCSTVEKVEYIPNDNTGYGAAHNIAINRSIEAGVRQHLVLNSDVCFSPSILQELSAYLESDPTIGLVQPLLRYPDGSLQYSCRLLPTPANVFLRRFIPPLGRVLDRRYLLKEYDHATPIEAVYLQGSFMLLNIDAIKDCGAFDERFFMYPEDIDLTRRMYPRYRAMYYPMAEAIHDHHAASYHNMKMLRIHAINMIRYFNKWGWLFDKSRRQLNRRVVSQIR